MLEYSLILGLLFIILFIISIFLRIAVKLRLFIPLLFALIVSLFFRNWASANSLLVDIIFIGLIVLCLASWIFTLIRKIKEWRLNHMNERLVKDEYLKHIRESKQNVIHTVKPDDLCGE